MGKAGDVLLRNCGAPQATYAPVPYRLQISLFSYCKNQEDSLQIIENVLPYFQPGLNVNIVALDEFNITMAFPVILNSVTTEDNYEDLNNNRMIINRFEFNMDIQLFGPVDTSVAVIKETDVNVASNKGPEESYQAVVVPRTANKTDTYTIEEHWTVL